MNITRDISVHGYRDVAFDELLDDLLSEIRLRNYRITRVNEIDNIHQRQRSPDQDDITFKFYRIVEFCNLGSCADLISADHLAGVFMPVRFIVFQRLDTKMVYIAFLKPSAFAEAFKSQAMGRVAAQLESDMLDIARELAL